MQKTTNTLCDYTKLYKTFANELSDVIEDYKFVSNGGELRYAVDFSEMFAFILPAKSYKEFFLFNEENDDPLEVANLQALHQLLLKHLFFESPHKLILLPPYVWELNSFIKDLVGKTLDQFIDLAFSTFVIANKKIKEQENYLQIKSIIEKVDADPTAPLSDEDNDKLVHFAQEFGPILTLTEELKNDQYSLNLLRKLLKEGESVFETLDKFSQAHLDNLSFSRSDLYDEWYSYLLAGRGERRSNSASVDASAVDQIGQINQYLQANDIKMRVPLFTRSFLMHTLFDEKYRDGNLHGLGNYSILRHPRVYSVLSILNKSQLIDPMQLAKEELEAIDTFTKSIPSDTPDDQSIPRELKALMDKIENDWKKAQALILSTYGTRPDSSETNNGIDQTRKILNLLNTENIKALINSTLDNLLKEIEFSYNLLESSSSQSIIDQDAASKNKRRPTTQSIPYYLHFSSEEAQNLVKAFGPGKEYEMKHVIEAFNTGFNKEFDHYERFLAMAYILGVLNKWDRAKSFCEHTISLGEMNDQAVNEGKFFLSICLRKIKAQNEFDLKSFLLAQSLLDEALKVWPDDPRYLTEKGSQIIRMNLLNPAGQDKAIPTGQTGLYLLYQAEKSLDPQIDKELYVLILNNRLYYNLSTFQKIESCADDLTTLNRLQFELEPNEELWPSYLLDTVAWGEWQIYFDEVKSDETRKNKIIRYLEMAIKSDEITDKERQVRMDHLNAVRVDSRKILR